MFLSTKQTELNIRKHKFHISVRLCIIRHSSSTCTELCAILFKDDNLLFSSLTEKQNTEKLHEERDEKNMLQKIAAEIASICNSIA